MTKKNSTSTWRQAASLIICSFVLAACAPLTIPKSPPTSVSSLRFIGVQRLPWHQPFQNTVVGGLSGIDYDAASGDWILISDDRSGINPARYYRARLNYDEHAFNAVELAGVAVLPQPDGSTYPSKEDYKLRGGVVPDLETIRVDPRDGSIWYASEGDAALGLSPFVRHAARDGSYLAELPLPAMFNVSADHSTGPRDNLSFEGMSFTPDGRTLWVSMEGPLYQDGAAPDPQRGAINRITRFARDGKVAGQYAYPLAQIPATPGKDRHGDNGISEIVALDAMRLLVMERAGVQADDRSYRDYVRIYEIDAAGATDVQHLPSLQGAAFKPVTKRLVLDLNQLNLSVVDNLEGMSFGPVLANGHASLVLVSDDNFGKDQVTQLLLFEVVP